MIHDEKLMKLITDLVDIEKHIVGEPDPHFLDQLHSSAEWCASELENYVLPTNEELMEALYDNACAHVSNGSWSDFGLKLDSNLNKLIQINDMEKRIKVVEEKFAECSNHVYLDEISNLETRIERLLK